MHQDTVVGTVKTTIANRCLVVKITVPSAPRHCRLRRFGTEISYCTHGLGPSVYHEKNRRQIDFSFLARNHSSWLAQLRATCRTPQLLVAQLDVEKAPLMQARETHSYQASAHRSKVLLQTTPIRTATLRRHSPHDVEPSRTGLHKTLLNESVSTCSGTASRSILLW